MYEEIAFLAVSYIVGDEDLLYQFLAHSGAHLADLKARLQDRDFLGSVLDFLLENEAVLQAFCTEKVLSPEQVWKARATYPGMATWEST